MGGAVLASLSGCALVPLGPPPAPLAPPTGALLDGQRAAQSLREALDAAAASGQDAPHATLLAWALSVSDDQLAALSLPPARSPGASAGPAPTAAPSASPEAALSAAADAFAAQSTAADAARPLVWAAMAAWARALATHWAAATASLEPARTLLEPAAQEPAEAVQAALDAAGEAVYGLEVATGAPGLSGEETSALRRQRAQWLTLRDALTEASATASPAPTPVAPWYRVERPTDAAGARALAARLQGDALPVLGRAFAHAPSAMRPAISAQLDASASGVATWGGLMQRWPGLPLR